MAKTKAEHKPFEIKDCALAAIATGRKAQNLRELRDEISTIDSGSLYYHFWSGLLRPRFDDPEYHNDFAAWVRHSLNDKVLAEKLSMIDPSSTPDIEQLRADLVDIIEERLDEIEYIPWCKRDESFHFIKSQIVVFNTEKVIGKAGDLLKIMPTLTSSSVFYHFIDARRRTFGNIDDFSSWLYGFNDSYSDLIAGLAAVDPFFWTLTELKGELVSIVSSYFKEVE